MSDMAVRKLPAKGRPTYFDIGTEDDDVEDDLAIPRRKMPFIRPAQYRARGDFTSNYAYVFDAKSARRHKDAPTPVIQREFPRAIGWSQLVCGWDLWDYVVALGLLLLVIGLSIPLLSKDRELAVLAPLGAALIGLGALKARHKNNSLLQ